MERVWLCRWRSKNLWETNFFDQWNNSTKSFVEKISGLNASIMVKNIEGTDTLINRATEMLSQIYKRPSGCILFVSPGERFFYRGRHRDIEELFIYQLFGAKRWDIYERQTGGALARREVNLCARKTMYLPSVVEHRARCEGNVPSVHLTFAVEARPKMDFVNYLLKKAMGSEMLSSKNFWREIRSTILSFDKDSTIDEYKKFCSKTSYYYRIP